MRKAFILFVLTVTTQLTVGQTKTLTTDSDTVFWYKYYNLLANEAKIERADKINAEFFFRFWDGYKVIDLSLNHDQIQATVVFLLRQSINERKGRLYFKRYRLSGETASKIYQLISKYNMTTLPTDNQIQGWEQGEDGITYISEQSDDKSFSFKNYWTPTAQSGLREAGQLLDFIKELDGIDELKLKYNSFMARQPFSSWYGRIDGSIIVSRTTNAR